MTPGAVLSPDEQVRVQRRTILVLSSATILGGLGAGAALSVGALLLAEVSGNDAISGLSSALFNAGAALAGIPLAALANRLGRRPALVVGSVISMLGALIAVGATVVGSWVLLGIGTMLLGVSTAVQLLSRFSATDLALAQNRGRDLSLVVWAITVGAVVGPNLIGPGAIIGGLIGVTPLAGAFVFPFVAQLFAALLNWFGLRPDPLLAARQIQQHRRGVAAPNPGVGSTPDAATTRRGGSAQILVIIVVAMAQAIMVGLMAMTPLHLMHHEGTPELVGFTLSLHIAGMYAFSPVFGTLAGRIGRVPVILLGWLLLFAAILLSGLSGTSHLLVQAGLVLLGLGWSAVTVAGATLLTEITPLAMRPKWQGRSDACMSASGALAGALSGVAFAAGDFSFLALMTGPLLLIGVAATIAVQTRRRRAAALAD